jgi:hypothetical protein
MPRAPLARDAVRPYLPRVMPREPDSASALAPSQPPPDLVPCTRCRMEVVPVRPWPHWRKVQWAHRAGLGLALCGAPVILADGFVMIPMLMLYMSAIGPLNGFVRERPTCSRCGAEIERSFPRLVRA